MRTSKTKLALLATSAIALFLGAAPAAWADGDPLVQLLQSKGVISAEDAQALSNVPADQQRDKLVELLRAKGVLTAADAANVTHHEVARRTEASPVERAEATPVARPQEARSTRVARAPVAHTITISDSEIGGEYEYATDTQRAATSPLSFQIGGVSFYPGGDIRATAILRSANTGSVLATNFNAIPFKNTIQGNRSEFKITGQGTTLDLRAVTDIGPVHVVGYTEFDFNGGVSANAFVNTNSYALRSRLAYMDASWDGWELSAGQMYSWLTPNRVGLGPDPSSVFLTNNVDDSFNVGLTWTRATQVRIAYHPDENWAFGLGIENPDPFVGIGEVIFPFAFNAQLGAQFDAGNNAGAPSPYPDIVGKLAYDDNWGGHSVHAEVTGLLTSIALTDLELGNFRHHNELGGGVGVGLNFELFDGFHAIANGFYSDGGGRYIGGLGPDTVIRPIDLGGGNFGVTPSLVRSESLLAGFEYQMFPDTVVSAYYGGANFERNAFQDITSPLLVKPFIGFGGTNSPNSANRYIQEATLDVSQTFWEDPTYGSVQFVGQFSYLQRHPWFVALGAPGYAKTWMGFGEMRFLFP